MSFPVLKLKRGEDRRLRAGHLWIFSNEVDTAATPLTAFEPGAAVQVLSDRDQFLGFAYVNPRTLIAARIVGRDAAYPLDASLIVHRLRVALALRERLYREPFYRLVFGESDGLPGLVLDRYGDVVVAQSGTAGIDRLRADIEAAVERVVHAKTLVWKNDSGARELEGLDKNVTVAGDAALPAEIAVREQGVDFVAPLGDGQKTGWFYDQAANRERLHRYLPAGARVLDVCSYVGAWAITALKAGAGSATCVDSSAMALEYVSRNARANGVDVTTIKDDAFDALKALQESGARFDAVILDPPAFAKRKKDTPQAQAAYRKLNQLALPLIERDGLLVSCSCSYHMPAEDLSSAIQAAARHSARFVQVLELGGQSPDHPVHPAIPETRYLKSFFCRVTRD
ncbi:MAG: rRNA (cytosine1962-C5)-methyltransferase [Steroidobacteraceae bacterium]|jgi:23S rRNA (cytosine1962-C5)-methyltransferase|nr:rRNA (cytosine1962-C5)-methyltransferase [Steroidobacteraceae bacterium]